MPARKEISFKIDENGCFVCTSHSLRKGYPAIYRDGKRQDVHRYLYKKYLGGKLKPTEHVCHKCNNAAYINIDHLYLGNAKTNLIDVAYSGNRDYQKLKPVDIPYIKELCKVARQTRVASFFGISNTQLSRILKGKSWAHIGINYREEYT